MIFRTNIHSETRITPSPSSLPRSQFGFEESISKNFHFSTIWRIDLSVGERSGEDDEGILEGVIGREEREVEAEGEDEKEGEGEGEEEREGGEEVESAGEEAEGWLGMTSAWFSWEEESEGEWGGGARLEDERDCSRVREGREEERENVRGEEEKAGCDRVAEWEEDSDWGSPFSCALSMNCLMTMSRKSAMKVMDRKRGKRYKIRVIKREKYHQKKTPYFHI